MDSFNSQLLISDTGAAMFDVDAKEMKEKREKTTQLWKELLLYLESSWVNVEELEIVVGKLLKKKSISHFTPATETLLSLAGMQ